MRIKAIGDLAQLPDRALFSEVSAGLGHILDNAIRIECDAKLLAEHRHPNGCSILRLMVEEEAAKFLILLDAVRCPRVPPQQFARQLKRFYQHLAKRIYAEASDWRPATFGELVDIVDGERQEFYLDGPMDVDWIFPNRLQSSREQTIYVDYAYSDEGHIWLTPFENHLASEYDPPVLRLAKALNQSGCTAPEALALIADLWRPLELTADYPWTSLGDLNYRTLKDMETRKLLSEQPQEVYGLIVEVWPFPMHSLDLRRARVDQSELREIQEQWTPDW